MTQTEFSRTSVEFEIEGDRVVGLLYAPASDGPVPCVVMAGGWCYVKELAQPAYAEAFARNGMGALIFDYRHSGGSDGEPRQHLDPWKQIDDYRHAITYVEALDWVDPDRIGAWGVSYSGGHVIILGALDDRVKAICGVVPMIDGHASMRLVHGTLGFRQLQNFLLDARRKLSATGEHTYLPHQSVDEDELATFPFPESKATFAKLKATQAPEYEGVATAASTEMLLAYDVMPYARRLLSTPTMLAVAEGDDHTHWEYAAAAFDAIPGSRKRLHIVPKSTHLSVYENPDTVRGVADACTEWFQAVL